MPRGSRSSSDRSASRYDFGPGRHADPFSSWSFDSDLFVSAVGAVLSNGDAVLFSLTSDGGALAIKLYSEGSRQAVYCADVSELELVLNTLKASGMD